MGLCRECFSAAESSVRPLALPPTSRDRDPRDSRELSSVSVGFFLSLTFPGNGNKQAFCKRPSCPSVSYVIRFYIESYSSVGSVAQLTQPLARATRKKFSRERSKQRAISSLSRQKLSRDGEAPEERVYRQRKERFAFHMRARDTPRERLRLLNT